LRLIRGLAGELPMVWGPLRDARLASRGLRTSRSRWGARQLSCGRPAVDDLDHRIVAWAPGGDGLVVDGRAPTSGTAARATTGDGSDTNPATSAPAGSTRAGVASRQASSRPRLASAPVGDGAPTGPFHDQIDVTGLGEIEHRWRRHDHANVGAARGLIVPRSGSAPSAGRSGAFRMDHRALIVPRSPGTPWWGRWSRSRIDHRP
jgi:hypothetical protein